MYTYTNELLLRTVSYTLLCRELFVNLPLLTVAPMLYSPAGNLELEFREHLYTYTHTYTYACTYTYIYTYTHKSI